MIVNYIYATPIQRAILTCREKLSWQRTWCWEKRHPKSGENVEKEREKFWIAFRDRRLDLVSRDPVAAGLRFSGVTFIIILCFTII